MKYRHKTFTTLMLLALLTSPVHAQSTDAIQAEVNQLTQQQQSLNDSIDAWQSEIEQVNQRVSSIQQQLGQAELAEKSSYDAMTEAHNKASSGEELAVRRATKASITYNRNAERVERLNKRMESHTQQLDDILKRINTAEALQDSNKQRLADLKRQLKTKTATTLEAQTASTVITPPKPKITKPAPVKASPRAQTAAKTGTWPNANAATASDIQFAKLQIAAAQNDKSRPPLPKVVLKSRSFGNEKLTYLGNDLYSKVIQVKSGRIHIKAFTDNFWVDVPNEDNNSAYRFIYDATSLSKPKVYAFRESLLN